MTAPNWNTALDNLDVADRAARIVAKKYKSGAVGSLAEYDDLYQEACILLATKPSYQGDDLSKELIRFRLVQDLGDLVRQRAKNADKSDSLDAPRVAA